MKVAVHQMCSGIDPAVNAKIIDAAIRDAAHEGAEMYFAPEMSALLDKNRTRAANHIVAEDANLALLAARAAAASCGIWVHIGSIAVPAGQADGRCFNRSLVIDSSGTVRAHYDKMHLFDVALSSGETWRESSAYAPGEAAVAVNTPLGLMGLTICYDMRFPDLYSALSRAGADIFAIPAAFTVPTGRAHWHSILRTRAIEAEAFVIAAAQSGRHEDGRMTYGHSLVVDPWGEVLLDMGDDTGLGFAELDLSRLVEVRAQIPVHQNRREIAMPVVRY